MSFCKVWHVFCMFSCKSMLFLNVLYVFLFDFHVLYIMFSNILTFLYTFSCILFIDFRRFVGFCWIIWYFMFSCVRKYGNIHIFRIFLLNFTSMLRYFWYSLLIIYHFYSKLYACLWICMCMYVISSCFAWYLFEF